MEGSDPAAKNSKIFFDIVSRDPVNGKILDLVLEDGRADPEQQIDACFPFFVLNNRFCPKFSKLKALLRFLKDDRVSLKYRERIRLVAINEKDLLRRAAEANKLSTYVKLVMAGIVTKEPLEYPKILKFATRKACLMTVQYILKHCALTEFPHGILSQAALDCPDIHEILLEDERVQTVSCLERCHRFTPEVMRVYISHPRVSGELCYRLSSSLKTLSPCYLQAAVCPKGLNLIRLLDSNDLSLEDFDLLLGRARLVPKNQKYFHSLRLKIMKLPNHIMSSPNMLGLIEQLYYMQSTRLKHVLKILFVLRPAIESVDYPIPVDVILHLCQFL